MKYTRKDLDKGKIEFTLMLETEEVARHYAAAVKKLSRDVKVAGFRAGRIPPEVAEKHIDPSKLTDEAVNSAVSAALVELIGAENLQILDRPDIAITKFVPAQILEFTTTLEIVPEAKLADFAKLKTKRESAKVSTGEVDEVVERLRQSAANKTVAKRAAKMGDEVLIDFAGYHKGEKFDGGEAKDYALTLGSNSFIPGFEKGIVGHKTGEDFDLELTFPKDYGAKRLAGKKVVFKINLKEVREVKLPALDDKFAKSVAPDLKTLDDLKNDIKKELTARAEEAAEQKFRDDLLNELSEKSDVATPEVLVQDQMVALERQFAQNLSYRGLTLEKYLEQEKLSRDEWAKKELRPAAEKRVKNSLIMAQLSREWNISASDDEVRERQQQILAQYNDPNLRANFETGEARRQIAQQIIADKVFAKLTALVGK